MRTRSIENNDKTIHINVQLIMTGKLWRKVRKVARELEIPVKKYIKDLIMDDLVKRGEHETNN